MFHNNNKKMPVEGKHPKKYGTAIALRWWKAKNKRGKKKNTQKKTEGDFCNNSCNWQ